VTGDIRTLQPELPRKLMHVFREMCGLIAVWSRR
jgi:hypothetical protein